MIIVLNSKVVNCKNSYFIKRRFMTGACEKNLIKGNSENRKKIGGGGGGGGGGGERVCC